MKKILFVILVFALLLNYSHSQFEFLKKKVEKEIEKELEKTEEGEEENKDKEKSKNEEKKEETKEQEAPKQANLQSYSKFDFVPGEKIIFYEDFSQDAIGDFPALWNTNGSAEVVTNDMFPGNWLKFVGNQAVWTDKLLNLPDNYTIEFDIIPYVNEKNEMEGYGFRIMQSVNAKAFDHGAVPGKAGFYYTVEYFGRSNYRTYINNPDYDEMGLTGHKDDKSTYQILNKKYRISVWVQRSRVRLYMNETKLFDLPKAFPAEAVKMDRIRFEDGAFLVSNIRIAVGSPDLRSKLLTEGKLVSYGIYFDVNKDIVKPESYTTIKGIADILKENPTLKIKIVGHTDSDGDDALNLNLSKRRAENVKNSLVSDFGIDASRIEFDGSGEKKPIAPNDSPANKALNRRVEFLKL